MKLEKQKQNVNYLLELIKDKNKFGDYSEFRVELN